MATYQAVVTKAKVTSIRALEMIETEISAACHFIKYLINCPVSHGFHIQYVTL